ncbi:hypothetical protein B296_00052357 [Ensete ventricosum]|uniref:Uncharacterized protein n=1 Tax=Ensete ventricosum TaxID=4639 RepID=A0A426Y2C9_ENSVE|nr:hypothetical protein B296_00052357 [Ensete ventricosum]
MDGATTSDGCLASRKEIATDWRMTTYLGCRPRDCASGSAAAVVAQCMRPEVVEGHKPWTMEKACDDCYTGQLLRILRRRRRQQHN